MKYLTPEIIAERWEVTKSVVYMYLRSGQLRGVKFGRCWRVKPGDLEIFEKEKFALDAQEAEHQRTGFINAASRMTQ